MITSVNVTKSEILEALEQKGDLLTEVREKFNTQLESDKAEAENVARSVARHILEDLDAFLDMHPQV